MAAPALVQTLGTLSLTSSPGSVTVGTATLAGDAIVVRVADTNLTSVPVITDSAGNTYRQIATSVAAGAPRTTLYVALNALALPHLATITVTPGSNELIAVVVEEWSSITGLDQFVDHNALSGTAITTAGFTTLQTNELLYAAISTLDLRTFTPDSGYTTGTQANNGQASPNETTTYSEYKTAAAAGAVSGLAASVSSTVASSAVLVSFISGVPFAATNVVATLVDLPLQVVVTWQAPTGFSALTQVVQRTNDGHTWNNLATLGPTATTYTDNAVATNTIVAYRIFATNAAGSTASIASNFITTPAPLMVITYSSIYSPLSVTLNWQSLSGATGYVPQRSQDRVTWTNLPLTSTAAATATNYVDSTVSQGQRYFYRVQGTNTEGTFTSPTIGLYAPGATQPVISQLAIDPYFQAAVAIWWTAPPSFKPQTYAVQRSPHGLNIWSVLATGIYGGFYEDEGVPSAAEWDYQVVSSDGTYTATSATVSITLSVLPPAEPALQQVAGTTNVTVSWPAVASAGTYTVQQSTDQCRTWTTLASGLTALTYTDTTPTQFTRLWYRVLAVSGGNSATGRPRSIFVDQAATPQQGLRVIVAGVDLSAQMILDQPRLDRQVSGQGSTLSFQLAYVPGPNTVSAWNEVEFLDGSNLLHTGWVNDYVRDPYTVGAENVTVTAPDAETTCLNATYPVASFEGQTAGWIVKSLIARHLPGLSTAGVQAGPVLPYVASSQAQSLMSSLQQMLSLGAAAAAAPFFRITPNLDAQLEMAGTLPTAPMYLTD